LDENNLLSKTNSSPENDCNEIHKLVHSLKRYGFVIPDEKSPKSSACALFEYEELPKNGIYLIFEKGERGHYGDRIVRIGTHTDEDRLADRLKEHFSTENKDRSIFRKNIGRALLKRDKDSFLEQWNLDLTSDVNKEKYPDQSYTEKKEAVEARVSQYIREAFSFCVIAMPSTTKDERGSIEQFLIQTISSCKKCVASSKWLGLHSPIPSIRKSYLWLTQHTNSSLSEDISIETIKKYVMK